MSGRHYATRIAHLTSPDPYSCMANWIGVERSVGLLRSSTDEWISPQLSKQ